MVVFTLGGVKSGKSILSQSIAKTLHNDLGKLYYVATMCSTGAEDDKRISRHINDRKGWGFTTIEEGLNLGNILQMLNKNDTVLIDSITALLSNMMFKDNKTYPFQSGKIIKNITLISKKVKNLIIVSDDIFSDTKNYSDTVLLYMKELSEIHLSTAEISDILFECINGIYVIRKGSLTKDIKKSIDKAYSLKKHLYYGEL